MMAERQLLRLGEYMVRRACRRLPQNIRTERYREWLAELPVILQDPQAGGAARRAVRMLGYAADTTRGAARMRARARRRPAVMTAVLRSLILSSVALVGWNIWNIAQAPAHPLNYLRLAWSLVALATLISMLAGPAARPRTLLVVGCAMLGVAVNLWDAVQAPGDWVNYGATALFLALLVALWLSSRWTRTSRRA